METPADFDFSHLHIEQATSRFDAPWLGDGAYLVVRPAGEANKGYNNAMLKLTSSRTRDAVSPSVTLEQAERDRKDDRFLYPRFIIVGWGNIRDKAGKLIEHSQDAAERLVAALPNWVFDRLRVHCLRPEKFVTVPAPRAEDIAGN